MAERILSPIDLDAIEARADAATCGPWACWPEEDPSEFVHIGESGGIFVGSVTQSADDARFIAAARTDIPLLVAEVRRLRNLARKG